MCKHVAEFKPDVVITEKGLSDLATHFLTKAGISAIRRLRKTDNNRIARACGATIVHRPEEIRESDIGTGAGLFEVKKIGDEFFTFIVDCKVIFTIECCFSLFHLRISCCRPASPTSEGKPAGAEGVQHCSARRIKGCAERN